LGALVH